MSGNLEAQGELGTAAMPGGEDFGKIPVAGAAGAGDSGDSSLGILCPGMRRSPGMCGSRGGFASSGASRERLRHPPLPRVELGRIWLPGRIWPLGAEPGALFSRPDCAWNPRRARLRRSCSGLGWLPAEGGAEGSGIIPGVMIPNSGIFSSPAPLALLPTLPSPALPWLSRSKVNPAPGLSVAPPAAAGAGGSSDPAGSAPGDAGGAGGSRGLLWSILVPHPGLFQEGGWEDGEGLGRRSRLLLAIPRKSRCPPQGAWGGPG